MFFDTWLMINRLLPRSAELRSTLVTNHQPRKPRPARMERLLRPRRLQLLRRLHVLTKVLSLMIRSTVMPKELLPKKKTNSSAPARETPTPSSCPLSRFEDGRDKHGDIMPSSAGLEDCRRHSCCYLRFGAAEQKRS